MPRTEAHTRDKLFDLFEIVQDNCGKYTRSFHGHNDFTAIAGCDYTCTFCLGLEGKKNESFMRK